METKQYVGTKVIKAKPMTLGSYNVLRGWVIPENEDPNREGYVVEYNDGYITWSPKEVFEESYRESNGLTFGIALELLKQGKLVARKGWNGEDMFLFIRPGDSILAKTVIENVKSIPDSAKQKIHGNFTWSESEQQKGLGPDKTMINFSPYICMSAADGTIVNGWVASQTDMLSDDWYIVK